MSKNRKNCGITKRNNTVCSQSEYTYLQSSNFNTRMYLIYRDWLESLAVTRFHWVNLPETCDERFLETQLLYNGVATISHPKNSEFLYSLQAVTNGKLNMYGNPIHWDSLGYNGFRYFTDNTNGVLIYDNLLRRPMFSAIDLFARQLANFDRTLQTNLNAQKTPVVFVADQTHKQDIMNLFMQVENGEPALIGTNGLKELVNEVTALNVGIPLIAEDLQTAKATLFSEVYDYLGIQSLPRKSERMIEDEVLASNEGTKMRALDCLSARRQAAHIINERFGTDIDVVLRHDNESDNFNITHNIKDYYNVIDFTGSEDK